MSKKTKLLVSILFIGLIISACHVGSKTPDNTLPISPQENSISDTEVYEENSITAALEQMYPAGDLKVSTTYPVWDIPTIKLQDLRPPTEANGSVSGKASISGLLYAYNISVPLSNTSFVLIPAVIIDGIANVPPILTNGNPADGDFLGKTDENGVFYLDDIMPGKYYFLVNYPDHSEIAVDPENTTKPLLLEFDSDTSYPLGVIMILS